MTQSHETPLRVRLGHGLIALTLIAGLGLAALAVPGTVYAKNGADDGTPTAGNDDGTPDQGSGDAPGTGHSGKGRGPGNGGGAGGSGGGPGGGGGSR